MKDSLNTTTTNILYSFRRCPYAMRARLALLSSKIPVIIREISLKNKPIELKTISKKATVPCLHTNSEVLSESLEIMLWALSQNDPENLLDLSQIDFELIDYNDGPFKTCLDRTKYRSRYQSVELDIERKIAKDFLEELNCRLKTQFILGEKKSLVDLALLPFIRQYAFIDKTWFDNQGWRNLSRWLTAFLQSTHFARIQYKYPIWKAGDTPIIFSN